MEKLNIDCLILIFNELRKDNNINSLYSCLLVNKEWCHLIVPILWEYYPYFYCEKSKEKFCNVILSTLPTSSKQLLFDNNIILPSTIFSNSLTFNYISFCKSLSAEIINNIMNFVFKEESLEKNNILEEEIYKLFISQCKGIRNFVWQTSQRLLSFPGALTCFSQLYSLDIDLSYVSSNNLYEMSQICKNLNVLIAYNFSQDNPGLISLIDAQRNLESVIFDLHINIKKVMSEELSRALARKGCTIDYLSLYDSVGVISHSFLTSLNKLKDLIIFQNCGSCEGAEEFKKHLANSNFPDLQSLSISGDSSCFEELAMLIEKTKGNILDIYVYTAAKKATENTGMLIKAITSHCPKIDLNEINDIGDELLDTLTKFSPKSLVDVSISGDWVYSVDSLENFFECYRGRKLNFDINNYFRESTSITTEHMNVINKYYNEGIIKNSNLLDDLDIVIN